MCDRHQERQPTWLDVYCLKTQFCGYGRGLPRHLALGDCDSDLAWLELVWIGPRRTCARGETGAGSDVSDVYDGALMAEPASDALHAEPYAECSIDRGVRGDDTSCKP
jgi:hypothetical protein